EVPKLRTSWLVERYGKDILAKLGTEGIILAHGPNGTDGDSLAAHLNLFEGSGDKLVEALTDLPSRTQTITEQTKVRI
ncbi:hypothetical protein, partial [Streptococcus pneumoniae]|uniref:hypothetical protein n=1 Tax=Streptococcus pneumoniae TaxID=1313 RepID=UPI0018B0B818